LTEQNDDRRECALCRSRELRRVLEGTDRRFGAPGVFQVVRCDDCGLMFQDPMPAREEVEGFCEVPRAGGKSSRLFDAHAGIVNASRARFLCAHAPAGRVLDVGCGNGDFLAQAKKRGWDVTGVELSALACEEAAARLGGNVYRGDLAELELPAGSFDAATLWHVLEHITTPHELLEELNRVLKPGGALIVEVPDCGNPVFRAFRQHYFHLDLPRHVFFYDRATLRAMIEGHGFAVDSEDAPSWYYPEGIAKSMGYLLEGEGNGKTRWRKALSLMACPFFLLVTCGYLAATRLGAHAEVARIVAIKPSENHGIR